MNIKANRRKWIKALRSGQYLQGTGMLLRDNKYCCLGVLAHIAGIEPVFRSKTSQNTGTFAGEDTTAPRAAMEFVGLHDREGRHLNDEYLTTMNDGGSTFDEIADLIEQEPDGLFTKT